MKEIVDGLTISDNPLESIIRADRLDAVEEVVFRQHRLEMVEVESDGTVTRIAPVRLLAPRWPPCPLGL
jgi:hypothetical protein